MKKYSLLIAAVAICAMLSGCLMGQDGKLNLDQLNNLNLTDLANLDLSKLPINELATVLGSAYGVDAKVIRGALETAGATGADSVAPPDIGGEPVMIDGRKFQPIKLLPKYPVFIEGNCTHGGAIVQVNNIPIMTEANKDTLNKTLLFALASEDGSNFVAVYHRYLQPDWPDGAWWPTWRIEAGHCNCVEEWHIFQSQPLPGGSAQFEIAWDGGTVRVRHTGTGDEQVLHTENQNAFADITADVICYDERPSTAAPMLRTWSCQTTGAPGGCK